MSLQTTLAGLQLETCIYNAAGPRCTYQEELEALARSDSGAILTKSCTKKFREGNPGKRYYQTPDASINSTGLANLGYNFYNQIAPQMKALAPRKPYIISIAGLTLQDNLDIIDHFHDNSPQYVKCNQKIDALEVNLSCPNIEGKSQVAYDSEATELYLRKIFDLSLYYLDVEKILPIGLKLSPYFDHQHFVNQANIIQDFPVRFVTCINSIGHGLFIDPETESTVIHPNQGHGGVGGKIIFPVALANVRKFRQLLPQHIQVVGCGGVTSGEDVFSHILAGASAVQVGTEYMKEGPGIFTRLSRELKQMMNRKNYQNIEDFRGKLKNL